MKNNDWVKQIANVKLADKKTNGIYSQFGEEPIWDFIFSNIGMANRFLVDFGAGGLGSRMSNSRYLMEKGWKGFQERPILSQMGPLGLSQAFQETSCKSRPL